MAETSFLHRLRERKLVQWALPYLAGAFVVFQLLEVMAEPWSISPAAQRAAHLVLLLGLFITLVLAWFREERGQRKARRWEALILTALLVAAGFVLFALYSRGLGSPGDRTGPSPSLSASDDRPSVAALPWLDRSPEQADRYFVDGIHEEILNRMANIQGLRVISRQSVIQFRDSPMTARQIAAELEVRYILEGGLLRAGDSVRLNVTLIDAETDEYVWAASFDRQLSVANLLSIQAEIAQTVADRLRATVTPEEQVALERPSTQNLEAYDYYLQGRSYYLRPGYRQEDFEAAERLYQRALALDPDFALAHASLSRIHGLMYWERFDPSPERLRAQEREARTALRLQPDLPQAHAAVGWMHYVRGDFEGALEEYTIALDGLPNDAEMVARIGYTQRRLGHWPEVFLAFERATRLNPRDANLFYDLGGHSFAARRRYADAVRAYDRAAALAPDLYDAGLRKGFVYLQWQGQLDSLSAGIARTPADLHLPELDQARADLALWERDADGLYRVLDALPGPVLETQLTYLPKPVYAAWAHRLRGEEPAALAAFDSARAILEPLARERPRDERLLLALGYTYAGLGRTADAAASLARAVRLRETGSAGRLPMQMVEVSARILAQAGLLDEAVDRLETLLAGDSSVSVHGLRLDPLLDPLRDHPRFRALLEQYADQVG